MKNSARLFRIDPTKGQPLPEFVTRILAPYFPSYDLTRIRVHEGIPWYVTMNPDAYTDNHQIFFRPGRFDAHSPAGIALIGHEITHSVQYHTYGKWRFRASYLGDWSRKFTVHWSFNQAYFHNEFEIEARAMEQRIFNDLLFQQMHGTLTFE